MMMLFEQCGTYPSLFLKESGDFGSTDEFFQLATETLDMVVKRVWSGKLAEQLYDAVYVYLSEEDKLSDDTQDIIFVFASLSTLRIEKAIELYRQGLAKRIMISGFGLFYKKDKTEKSEAERLRDFAIENGVTAKDVIVETKSITIPDNVKSSLNLLESSGIEHKNMVLLNSPFAQRRGWAHFNKFSEGVNFLRVNAGVSEAFSKNACYKNEIGTRVVLNEFIKMKSAELLNTI